MCGIVGLHLKTPLLYPRLGSLLSPMLDAMSSRGPDSAGIAIYDDELPEDAYRYSLRTGNGHVDWGPLTSRLVAELGEDVELRPRRDAAVLVTRAADHRVPKLLRTLTTDVRVVGEGRAVEIFKDVGSPRAISERYDLSGRVGYQGLGHTRMATESAVTTDHSHPFSPAPDLCLVHNGSLSNYATLRRRLLTEGIEFDTDNDSEVAARYIAHRMRLGDDLGAALEAALHAFDGFFTLLVTTRTQFAVVRDAFACKPAVVAETDDYVAMASEYQALTNLPGISEADVFEPMPQEIHLWTR